MAPRTKEQRAHAIEHPDKGIRCGCGAKMTRIIEKRDRVRAVYRRRVCDNCGARRSTSES